jgi:hypothetical protein
MKAILSLLLLISFVSNAQKLTQNKLTDSLLKTEKINFMNAESDSINGRWDPITESAQIIYSPDNRIKILTTNGESCGAYCNPYNKTWIYVAQKKGTPIEKAFDFIDPVTEIKILTKTKKFTDYLVLTSNWCRPRGFEAGETWNFHHIRLQGDSIQFLKPIFTDKETNSAWIFSSSVLCVEKENLGMKYNDKTKTISFSYLNYSDQEEESKCYYYVGKYSFVKGRFVQVEIKKNEAEINH